MGKFNVCAGRPVLGQVSGRPGGGVAARAVWVVSGGALAEPVSDRRMSPARADKPRGGVGFWGVAGCLAAILAGAQAAPLLLVGGVSAAEVERLLDEQRKAAGETQGAGLAELEAQAADLEPRRGRRA